MTSARLERMRANPKGDWTIQDVEAVCREHGVNCEAARGGGSHYKVFHPVARDILQFLGTDRSRSSTSAASFALSTPCGWQIPMTKLEYPVLIEPLSPEDGGGFLATVPDLPRCVSDGETPEEALVNVRDAIAAWIEAAQDMGRPIPRPSARVAAAE